MAAISMEVGALRGAMHSMIIALESAALDADRRGDRYQARALRDRVELGEAALKGPGALMLHIRAREQEAIQRAA